MIRNTEKKIYNIWEHNGWGNRISWMDWKTRSLEGHLPLGNMIKKDDEVRAKMQSGQIARFKVKKVRKMSDPPDQFFADLIDIGYLNER